MDNRENKFTPTNKMYMLLIAIFIGVLFYYKHRIEASVFFIIYVLLIVYNFKSNKKRENQWKNFVENFSEKMDIANSSTFVNLPFPLVMVDFNGNILWYNRNFCDIVDDKEYLGSNIKEVNKELNVKFILDGRKSKFYDIIINNNYFDVFSTVVYADSYKREKDAVTLFYFYEVTQKHNLKVNIEENKYSIMLIEVDNLNDVLKTTSEDQSPLLAADIERNINSYAQSLNAMIKKYSSNKYVLTVQDKLIQREMEKKFEILDIIRELNYGNKLTVTLSVGVGRGGENPHDNYRFAESAKELALGRGGDQVVVKTQDNLSFFGGRSKEVEKRTKVKARIIAHALLELINESDKIIIMGHKNIDVDCLGAAVGLYNVISQLNKSCNIVLENTSLVIKDIKKELMEDIKYREAFINTEKALEKVTEKTLVILVDVHNEGHVESMNLIRKSDRIVIIDHHRKAPDYIQDTLLSYVETYASSTSELVTEMLPYLLDKINMTKTEAMVMLAGIYIDTKNFYFKTGVRTFEAAAVLKKLGADTITIKKMFKEDYEIYLKKLEIIKTVEMYEDIAIAVCPEDLQDNVIAAQVADEFLNIKGVEASFVFVKIKESVFISGRSLDKVNVQMILEQVGGGGHMTIAGAKLNNINIEEAVNLVKDAIEKYLREGE
ncbi:DHH family phosphoesterase [Clostridiaceae bacterium 14S0207]|nr:DHH family phosphoesterase [Clostridiaceae bacterium 14S0207]